MLYALAHRSVSIRAEHLRASLTVVDYCRASARLLFGSSPVAIAQGQPDPLWLRLLNAITIQPGISRTGLRELIGHKIAKAEIDAALASLTTQGLARSGDIQPDGGGRPAECWWPVQEQVADGESLIDDNPTAPLSSDIADPPVPGREGTNPFCQVAEQAGEETLGREQTPGEVREKGSGDIVDIHGRTQAAAAGRSREWRLAQSYVNPAGAGR
jgi:hypothetical protein